MQAARKVKVHQKTEAETKGIKRMAVGFLTAFLVAGCERGYFRADSISYGRLEMNRRVKKKKRRKILVMDIDGTLLNSQKKIGAATKKAIIKIQKKGHRVVLASGRPTTGVLPIGRELQLEKYKGYLLAFNGAYIVECGTGEMIWSVVLDESVIPQMYDFAARAECGLAVHVGNEAISAFEPDDYITMEAHMNGMPVRRVENFVDFVKFGVYKCLMTAEPARAAVLEKQLQERFPDDINVSRSAPYFIEVMPRMVDKAAALDVLLKKIGFSWEDTVVCGDGYNDVSMINCGKVGVAMGNAQPEVKAAADYVTKDNNSDGLVKVIRKFMI